jgi:hypothetical protein
MTVAINFGISLLLTSHKILSNIIFSRLSPKVEEIIGIINMGFDVTDQLLMNSMRQSISYSETSRKPMIQLGGKYCTIFS